MFVMCKGDAHNSYGLGTFDHIEPIFGIYSNGSYNVTAVGDDDWIVHGSDYSPDGDMNKGYFRQLNKMTDDTTMTGNCANAQPGYGKNEMFPCLDQSNASLVGITGLKYDASVTTYNTSLYVSYLDEPNIRDGINAVGMYGTLEISTLTKDKPYITYRYDSFTDFPTDGLYQAGNYSSTNIFTPTTDTYIYVDPKVIDSSGSTYYVTIDWVA